MPAHSRSVVSRTALALAAALSVSACENGGTSGDDAALETDAQRASYGVGLNMGRSLAPAEGLMDMDAFMRGVRDAMTERDPALTQEEIASAMETFSREVQEAQEQQQSAAGEANRAAGEAYLAENAAREGVQTTESGLQYEVVEEGSGPTPGPTDRVRVHYVGTLPDGTEFDRSRDGEPAVFQVGQVIPGFAEGLQLMPVGSTYRFVIPGDLAYGPSGSGRVIGPDQTLVFELELIEILP